MCFPKLTESNVKKNQIIIDANKLSLQKINCLNLDLDELDIKMYEYIDSLVKKNRNKYQRCNDYDKLWKFSDITGIPFDKLRLIYETMLTNDVNGIENLYIFHHKNIKY